MGSECENLLTGYESLTRNYSGRGQFNGLASHPTNKFQWPDFLAGQHTKPVRVLLVDPDPSIRRVIAQELLDDLRIQLDGQAGTLLEGRRLLMQHEFEVLMVDVRLGDCSGFELIEEAKRHRSTPEVIAISSHEDESQTLRAFELGACGYLVKNAWLQSYAQAVLHVVNGGAVVTPTLTRRLLCHLNHTRANTTSVRPSSNKATLSEREREVLRLLAVGSTGAEIAARLSISAQTVNAHVKNIYRKLHVHTRAQAVSLASRQGFL